MGYPIHLIKEDKKIDAEHWPYFSPGKLIAAGAGTSKKGWTIKHDAQTSPG